MSLAGAIAATYQTIGVVVRVGGIVVPDVLEVSVSAGFDQINANAQLTCRQRPGWAEEGAPVEVFAVINGYQALLFTGELSGIVWSFFPGTVVLDARDLLSRTRLAWGGADRTYTSQDDAAVIRNLLEAMGIPSSQANIESSGWTLGIVQEVVLAANDVPYSLIERIDSLSGYRTFSLSSGIIVRRRVDGRASFSPAFSYTEGVNILSIRRRRGLDGIVNRALVEGLTYEGLAVAGTAAAANPYIPSPPGTISDRVQDDLVETDDRANLIAARIVADKNRRPDGFELDVSINPTLQPGMTIAITAPSEEAANARVLIENIRHTIGAGGATTSIKTTGGSVSGYAAGFPPVASFTVDLFQEHLDTGGTVPSSLIVGIADGSGSYDPDGTISAYSWSGTAYGGSISPASGSESVYRFVVTGGSIVGVTLVVTDDDDLSGTLTRDPLSLDSGSLRVEALYTAEDTVIAYSGDGQATWQTYTLPSGNATSLAPFAPIWGEIWGASSGMVYCSLDGLASDPLELPISGAGGAVTAVWVHELESTRVWAGIDNGKVYAGVFDPSGSGTITWSLAGTIPGGPAINELRESYAALGEVWATAGSALWRSGDSGASWEAVETTAGTAWRMAAGWDRNAAALLGDSAPVRYVEGGDPVFSPSITSVRGVSLGWRQPELYAADAGTASVLYLDEGFSGTATPAGTAPTQVNHLIRSGNEDRVVYLAGDANGGTIGGVLKWIPEVLAPSYIRRTGSRSTRMVGYGTPVRAITTAGVELVVPPISSGGGDDLIWHYRNGLWSPITPPLAGVMWVAIEANPFNPDEWLLLGNSTATFENFGSSGDLVRVGGTSDHALWYTANAGASWSAVPLPTASGGGTLRMGPPLFREEFGGQWFITAFELVSATFHAVVWRGEGATATRTQYTEPSARDIRPSVAPGFNGDILATTAQEGPPSFIVIPPTGTSYTVNSLAAFTNFYGMLDRWPPSKYGAVVIDGNSDLGVTADYRDGTPPVVLADVGGSLGGLADGSVLVGSRSGVAQITGLPSSPSLAVVAAAGQAVGTIHVDKQRRVAAAAFLTNTNTILTFNGATWTTVAMPAGANPSTYAAMAVLVRG